MNIKHLFWASSFVAVAILGGCATAPIPYKTPVSVTPPSGRVAVSQAVNLFDASGSQSVVFADGKATLESIVAAMPNGNYQAGNIHFGGRKRELTGISGFNRATLANAANQAQFLEGTTPLYSLFENELDSAVGGGSGKAAVVLITDGLATDYAGRSGMTERTVEAARAVVAKRNGPLCFHTVQTGSAPEGTALLRSLAGLTSCGSYRTAASLGSASGLQQFARQAYLGGAAPAPRPAPTPVSNKQVDTDGDGVFDMTDQCPNTLRRARVDNRGCWTLSGLRFAVNGAGIEPTFREDLAEDLEVLRANPSVRVRVDGHTDSDGSAAYNQDLSLRRATAVRDFFVSQGLDSNRFKVQGFGESQPVAPNDSRANKRLNRRVELTIID
jgi:OOP family OmpA-OmpF porin